MIKKIMFPQPDKERKEWCNLNGTWNFSFDKPIYDRKIKVPYSWTSPISGIGEECYSTAFYQKKILWNPQNERIFLCFGAVDYICTVYVFRKDLSIKEGTEKLLRTVETENSFM